MQNKRMKTFTAVALALLLVMLLAGCGASSIPKPQPAEGAQPVAVTGNCEIALQDGVIIVSGETDIMDGAVIHISVVSQDGMIIDSVKRVKSGDAVEERFIVTAEKYGEGVKTVTGYIACAPAIYGAQPQGVYDTYGKKFENVTGEFVWNNDGIIILFASERIEFTN